MPLKENANSQHGKAVAVDSRISSYEVADTLQTYENYQAKTMVDLLGYDDEEDDDVSVIELSNSNSLKTARTLSTANLVDDNAAAMLPCSRFSSFSSASSASLRECPATPHLAPACVPALSSDLDDEFEFSEVFGDRDRTITSFSDVFLNEEETKSPSSAHSTDSTPRPTLPCSLPSPLPSTDRISELDPRLGGPVHATKGMKKILRWRHDNPRGRRLVLHPPVHALAKTLPSEWSPWTTSSPPYLREQEG
jgi:hypothetical protein